MNLTSECSSQGKECWHENKLLSRIENFSHYLYPRNLDFDLPIHEEPLKIVKKMSLNIRPCLVAQLHHYILTVLSIKYAQFFSTVGICIAHYKTPSCKSNLIVLFSHRHFLFSTHPRMGMAATWGKENTKDILSSDRNLENSLTYLLPSAKCIHQPFQHNSKWSSFRNKFGTMHHQLCQGLED